MSNQYYYSKSGTPIHKWPPPKRASIAHLLPPVMSYRDRAIWATAPYAQTLPEGIRPDKPDIDYHRGNFCVEIPGAPLVPGGYDIWPSLLMTWFLDRLPMEWQHKSLDWYTNTLGLTHWNMSRRHSQNVGATPESFAETAALIKRYVPFNTVNLFSGDGETWEDMIPWLEALRKRNAVDIIVNCWQGDKWFSPWYLNANQFRIQLYAKRYGLKTAMHWINGQCLWLNASDDPRRPSTCKDLGLCADDRFYAMGQLGRISHDLAKKIAAQLGNEFLELEGEPSPHYHYAQFDTEDPISSGPNHMDIQGGLAKILQSIQYSPSEWPKLVFAEYCAEAQSRQLPPAPRTQAQEDIKGYLGCCVKDFGRPVYGFFNGGLQPNGEIL